MHAMRPRIYIGADHAGFHLKKHLVRFLEEHGYDLSDLGAHELDPRDDYPDIAAKVATSVAGSHARGILLCGNAEGVCMAANKVKKIRAALGYSVYAARTSRVDDDANILCLPARVLTRNEAERITLRFLTTEFSGAARHVRRLKKLEKLEQ